jgi:hypothetical protein
MSFAIEDGVQPLRVDLAAREDQRRAELLIEQRQEAVAFVRFLHHVNAMRDAFGRAARGHDVDAFRIAHEVARDHLDRVRHRRREHHRVAVAREAAQDFADLREKAEVEHVIGFVEDEDLDLLER